MSNNQANAGSFGGGGGSGSSGSGGGSNGGAYISNAGGEGSIGGGGSNGNASNSSSGHHQLQQQQQHIQLSSAIPQIVGGGSGSAVIATSTSTAGSQADNSNNMIIDSSPRESGDDSEDESEILEESPCGRWLKRREEVDQRDVPGIDCVHLAMDTEEGVEVVWNEVQYASLQELKTQEDKMRQVFDNLLQLDHPNIVKFHRYWTDTVNIERPRVIFITEYMSSGSLKKFLQRTKRNSKRLPLEAWKRWCTQILSALSYLHSCTPPIIHGNLTCDSIFIQHNGLVKIGSVVPDAVHYNVSQHLADMAEQGSRHFMAPEYSASANKQQLTAAVDIYAFGMCALEMAALEIQPSNTGDTNSIGKETILRTINSLEPESQRDLIYKCLRDNPDGRPSANDLLFHRLLFEVHSLKLLSAHCLVSSPLSRTMFSETVLDGMMQRYNHPDVILALVVNRETGVEKEYRLSNVPAADKLEKFVEDVKYGVYPLTAFSRKKPPHFRSRAASPERKDSTKSATPEPVDIESRRIVNMMCSVKKVREDSNDISMTILLRMDDKMNRQLTCQVTEEDSAIDLTNELVRLGFVHIADQDKIQALLEETLHGSFVQEGGIPPLEYGDQPLTFSATFNDPNQQIQTPQQQQQQQQQIQTPQQQQQQHVLQHQQHQLPPIVQQQSQLQQHQQQQPIPHQIVHQSLHQSDQQQQHIQMQLQQQQQQHQHSHQILETHQTLEHQHALQQKLEQKQQLEQQQLEQQHQHQQQQLQQQHQQQQQHLEQQQQQQQHLSQQQQHQHQQQQLEQQHQQLSQQYEQQQQHQMEQLQQQHQHLQHLQQQQQQQQQQRLQHQQQQQHIHLEQQQMSALSEHHQQPQQLAAHQQLQHHPHLEQQRITSHHLEQHQLATHQHLEPQQIAAIAQHQQQVPQHIQAHHHVEQQIQMAAHPHLEQQHQMTPQQHQMPPPQQPQQQQQPQHMEQLPPHLEQMPPRLEQMPQHLEQIPQHLEQQMASHQQQQQQQTQQQLSSHSHPPPQQQQTQPPLGAHAPHVAHPAHVAHATHLDPTQQLASHQLSQQQQQQIPSHTHAHLEQMTTHAPQPQQMATHPQILAHPSQQQAQQLSSTSNSHTNGNASNNGYASGYYSPYSAAPAQSHPAGTIDENVYLANPNVPGASTIPGAASMASTIPSSIQPAVQQSTNPTTGAVIDSNARHIPIATNNLGTTTATNMSTYNQYDRNWCVPDTEHHNYYQAAHLPQIITTSAPGFVLTSSELQGSNSSSATSTITTAPMSLGPPTTVMYLPQEPLPLPTATMTTAPLQHHHQQHQNHQQHQQPPPGHIIVPAPHHAQHPQGYHIQPQLFEPGAISSANIVLNNGASIALSSAPIPVGTNVSSITSTNPAAASTTIN